MDTEYKGKVIEVSRGRPALRVNLEGDGCWSDLADKVLYQTVAMEIACLPGGMSSGRPSVSLRIDLTDNQTVLVECSLDLLEDAIRAFRIHLGTGGRHDDEEN